MFEDRICPHCEIMTKNFNHGMIPDVCDDMLLCTTGYTCHECHNDWNEIVKYSIKYEYTYKEKEV